jgi:hypothetical protein
VVDATDVKTPADPVRNGQRWTVFAVDPTGDRIAARRLDDGARAVFSDDYLHQHVTHGYAVTVHSAQGSPPRPPTPCSPRPLAATCSTSQ